MHIIIWEFNVAGENSKDFTEAYGVDGEWTKLFRRAEGYMGTELLRSTDAPDTFITIDRWISEELFQRFHDQNADEYKQLDAKLEALTSSEKKLGVYCET